MATTTLGSLTLTKVACRIFTPNGDGYNDKARFEFENPEQLPIAGTVYGLDGARVGSLQPGQSSNTKDVMLWDGRDVNGRVVAGGIYIYQIEFQGKTATGTIVVAR
jgi:flagellar hook assembly protein FlgD